MVHRSLDMTNRSALHRTSSSSTKRQWSMRFVQGLSSVGGSVNGQDVFGVQVLPSGDLAMSGMFGRMRLYGNVEWDRKSLPGFVRGGLAWIRSPTGKRRHA